MPLEFARTPEELAAALDASRPRFVLLDLTGGFDYARVFETVAAAGPAARCSASPPTSRARQTQPWHARCGRVVTKETLTQELPTLLRDGVAA